MLSGNYIRSSLPDPQENKPWAAVLPELLSDFTGLLRDAFDLMFELGGVDNKSDLSYFYQPSISHHPQNKDFYDWTVLIELTRDAWLAQSKVAPLTRSSRSGAMVGNALPFV